MTESITIRPTDITGISRKDLPGGSIEVTDDATFRRLVQSEEDFPGAMGAVRIGRINDWLKGYGSMPYIPCSSFIDFPSETEEVRRMLVVNGTIS